MHAPVRAPAPDGLRPRDRRPRTVQAVGLAHAGASRARTHARRRDRDRAARPGRLQRRRDGDRRALPRRPLQPPGQRGRRPPRLRDLLRRRHDGGRQPGSLVGRGQLRPRQADRLLRRQPDHDRRHDRAVVRRREPRRALRSRRLARPARRGLRERRGARSGAVRGARGRRAAVVHPDPLAHRLPGAESRRHREVARLGARRGRSSPHQGSDGLRPRQALLGRRARLRAHVAGDPRRRGAGALDRALPVLARGQPGAGGRLGPGLVRAVARRLARGAAELRCGREDRDALGRAEGDAELRGVRARR